jgi:hypothetical protein
MQALAALSDQEFDSPAAVSEAVGTGNSAYVVDAGSSIPRALCLDVALRLLALCWLFAEFPSPRSNAHATCWITGRRARPSQSGATHVTGQRCAPHVTVTARIALRTKQTCASQVAPLYESVPPLAYGATERIVHYLTEELVRRGHDVTLFSSGNSRTSARLVAAVNVDCGETRACGSSCAPTRTGRASCGRLRYPPFS